MRRQMVTAREDGEMGDGRWERRGGTRGLESVRGESTAEEELVVRHEDTSCQ